MAGNSGHVPASHRPSLVNLTDTSHNFQTHTYGSFTFCDFCKQFIWGVSKQGYKCKTCGFNAHKNCRKMVQTQCGSPRKLDKSEIHRVNNHEFACYTYSSPTWCSNCNNFIWGLQKQGWKCNKCGVNAHGRCVTSFSVPCFIQHPAGVGVLQRGESIVEIREERFILPVDGFNIEDGLFGGSSHSFFIEFDRIRRDSASSASSQQDEEYEFSLFQNPVKDTWFSSTFIGKDYDTYVVRIQEPFFITTLKGVSEDGINQVQAILWFSTGKEQLIMPADEEEPSIYDVLDRAHYILSDKKYSILKVHRKTILHRTIEEKLIILESAQCSRDFTISVLSQLPNQRDEESIIGNDAKNEAFEEFLSTIGEKIELKGYTGFAGGLDTTRNKTGAYSYKATFCNNNIMFHVAPFLPRYEQKARSQNSDSSRMTNDSNNTSAEAVNSRAHLDRAHLVKNNVVCVVFMDEKTSRFQPSFINSKIIHTYACVQVHTDEQGQTTYKLNVSSNKDLPQFGPRLPNPPVFKDKEKFKNFLLAKLINATKASFMAPTFQAMRNVLVSNILNEFEKQLPTLTYDVPKRK